MPGPGVSIRPYLLASAQTFAASDTFDAVFGDARGTFLGGGGQVTFGRFFIDIGASRFKRDGERAVSFEGQVFHLGIPVTATVTPVEFTAGYRLRLSSAPRVVPYGGAGMGLYRYQETSGFAEADENVDERHSGFVAYGGAEFRLGRLVGLSLDARYTRVSGLLGEDGLSKDFGEDDLGGVAARVRVIVGR
jgi:opacity protein-like surface antigen